MTRKEFLEWLDTVPEDEPIFCFRAKDNAAVHAMMIYETRCEQIGSPPNHIKTVNQFTQEFVEWRRQNTEKCKTPD